MDQDMESDQGTYFVCLLGDTGFKDLVYYHKYDKSLVEVNQAN